MTNSNRKCGEITFCTQVGKRVYVLNCIYCSQICLQWEMFINHLEQEHDRVLTLEPLVQPETSKMPIKMEIQESIMEEPTTITPHTKKQKVLEESLPASAFDDPLESENSTSELCLESSIKIEQEEECSPTLNLFETEENSSEVDDASAERKKRSRRLYRAKLKADPLRWQESCRKANERSKRYRENLMERAKSDRQILEARKEKDRIRQRNYRAKKKLERAEKKKFKLEKAYKSTERNLAFKHENV